MNDTDYLSIGEVLQLLQAEFPDVTISKIRFLESQGLIDPERTPSGYRKFYAQDIERLKFILREQKDSYLPLKVIKHRLDAGESTGPVVRPVTVTDAGPAPSGAASNHAGDGARATEPTTELVPEEAGRHSTAASTSEAAGAPADDAAAVVADDDAAQERGDRAGGPSGTAFTFDELVAASALTPAQVREVERYGLLVGRPVGRTTYYDDEAVVIARLVAGFLRYGIEPRHLRMYRNAADREAGVFEQVILPLVKQRNPASRTQALDALAELSDLGSGFRDAMVRQALRGYTESL